MTKTQDANEMIPASVLREVAAEMHDDRPVPFSPLTLGPHAGQQYRMKTILEAAADHIEHLQSRLNGVEDA